MKKLLTLTSLILALGALSATRVMAYDHDDRGWYDANHHRHPFILYHHHHGYWDQRNGVRLFINVD
jgi:hypothetical protein